MGKDQDLLQAVRDQDIHTLHKILKNRVKSSRYHDDDGMNEN